MAADHLWLVNWARRHRRKDSTMARTRPARLFTAFVLLLCMRALAAGQPPALMLATVWPADDDPNGWWLSEKYDGVRGYWDGTGMTTRGGEPIALPAALAAELPPFPLDGELWAGRGRFEATLAIVRDTRPGPAWSTVRYMVFDAPAVPGPFETRIAAVEGWLNAMDSQRVQLVPQTRCTGRDHLARRLTAVVQQGGEGLMLRAPASPYESGRSGYLRKLKPFDDTEARVRGYNPGKGKYTGLVGSLQMELPNGTRFALGSGLSDAKRREPPPIGSLVTFKHHGWTTAGKPRFPVFWRVRELPAK
jgi:DNA ligase-1